MGVCAATVYRLCERGDLPHVRIVNSIRIRPDDLLPDPDVEFYVVQDPVDPLGKAVYPTAIDHPPPFGYRRYVDFGDDGIPEAFNRRGQADLARFCDGWMRNITQQQGLGDPMIRARASRVRATGRMAGCLD